MTAAQLLHQHDADEEGCSAILYGVAPLISGPPAPFTCKAVTCLDKSQG